MNLKAKQEYHRLRALFLSQETGKIPWNEITPVNADNITQLEDLPATSAPRSRVAVLKLNGGLGTSMGCTGPKSLVEIKPGVTFMDVILDQCQELKLVLMNSYFTDAETKASLSVPVDSFEQDRFPRLNLDGSEFQAKTPLNSWNPPGHGNVYSALVSSGMADQLLAEGIDYVFISNVDNLAATVDDRILNYVIEKKLDFLMEVTPKTKADVKGGALIRRDGVRTLLERAQVEANHLKDFEDIHTFSLFNTNSLWVSIRAIKETTIELPPIFNHKTIEGTEIVQLETAMGAAISCFKKSESIVVPRDRFRPVKTQADLKLI